MHKNPGLVAKYVALDREKFNSDIEKHHQVYRPGELDSYELHIQGHFLIEFPFYLDPFSKRLDEDIAKLRAEADDLRALNDAKATRDAGIVDLIAEKLNSWRCQCCRVALDIDVPRYQRRCEIEYCRDYRRNIWNNRLNENLQQPGAVLAYGQQIGDGEGVYCRVHIDRDTGEEL